MSTRTQTATPSGNINVNKLGYFLDGWADLVEGMGDKTNGVRNRIIAELHERKMPDISVEAKTGTVGITGERRSYGITSTHPGATTAIYVGEHGKDLYVAWRTFIRPVFNQTALLGLAGLALLLAVPFASRGYRFSPVEWVGTAIGLFIVGAFLMAGAGLLFKGSPFAFFFVEPKLFDADDITAMSLSAHKSILRALDNEGIDVSKLRIKRNFKGGRRGEEV